MHPCSNIVSPSLSVLMYQRQRVKMWTWLWACLIVQGRTSAASSCPRGVPSCSTNLTTCIRQHYKRKAKPFMLDAIIIHHTPTSFEVNVTAYLPFRCKKKSLFSLLSPSPSVRNLTLLELVMRLFTDTNGLCTVLASPQSNGQGQTRQPRVALHTKSFHHSHTHTQLITVMN
jgi:hypothetical protein